jgi:hypothetical protein
MPQAPTRLTKQALPFIRWQVFEQRNDNAHSIYLALFKEWGWTGSESVVSRYTRFYIKERQRMESTGYWSLEQADLAEVQPCFEVLAEVLRRTEGRVSRLTHQEVDSITKVRQAAPDMPPGIVWQFVQAYRSRFASDPPEPADDIDAQLALWPHLREDAIDREAHQAALVLIADKWPDSQILFYDHDALRKAAERGLQNMKDMLEGLKARHPEATNREPRLAAEAEEREAGEEDTNGEA